MITQRELERMGPSFCLSHTIAKLGFLATVISDAEHLEKCGLFDSPKDYEAIGCILREMAADLEGIAGALYPKEGTTSAMMCGATK